MKRFSLLIAMMCWAMMGAAQDIHFSQYWETGVLRNPATTGIQQEEFKALGAYRSQWSSMGKPYQTMAFSAQGRFGLRHSETDYLTLSLLFFSDKAGDAALKTTSIYPCINYNKHLSDPHNSYLSAGFTAGYVQRSFDANALTFDNMYQNGQVEPGLGAGETLPLAKLNYWDLGAGVSFNSSIGSSERIHYIIGLGGYHFTRPKSSFYERGDALNLAMRFNASFDLNYEFNDVWSVQLYSNLALQGAYKEAMLGGMIQWAHFSEGSQNFSIATGAQNRFGDAIIPMLRVDMRQVGLSLAYDINTSALKAATRMRGGLELMAVFKGFFHGEPNSGYAPKF
ncbi:MAG: PorP/SprF family type IX secretion system membrane protein [Bacteroidetes bacterium]|nr:PorP/SprF family type IX secretion system membrane protein [Bacteroidota bacterium]